MGYIIKDIPKLKMGFSSGLVVSFLVLFFQNEYYSKM